MGNHPLAEWGCFGLLLLVVVVAAFLPDVTHRLLSRLPRWWG